MFLPSTLLFFLVIRFFNGTVVALSTDHVNIGVMYSKLNGNGDVDILGLMQLTGVQLALDHINNKADGIADDLLPNVELRLVARAPADDFIAGAQAAVDLTRGGNGSGVIACIGPGNKEPLRGSSLVLGSLSIPVIGLSVRDIALSRSHDFPSMLRMNPLEMQAALAAADIALHFNWKRVTVFYSQDAEDYGNANMVLFQMRAKELGIKILSSHNVIYGEERENIISAKAVGARVFILLTTMDISVALLRHGHDMGLFGSGKQIIGGERISREEYWENSSVDVAELDHLLDGFIGARWDLRLENADPSVYAAFIDSWYKLNSTSGGGQSESCSNATDYYNEISLFKQGRICTGLNYSSFAEVELFPAGVAYDAAFAIARSYHALREQNSDPISANNLHNDMLRNLTFDGVTGEVSFDTTYERFGFNVGGRAGDINYRILNYGGGGIFREKLVWNSINGLAAVCLEGEDSCLQFNFNTKDNSPPRDRPSEVVLKFPHHYRNVLFAAGAINIFLIAFYAFCLCSFRERRIVKITQPQLSYIILLGALLACIACIISTKKLQTEANCSGIFWLSVFGFALVYIVLALKIWRVYAVSGTLSKRVVGIKDVYIRLALCLLFVFVPVVTTQVLGISVEKVTIIKDQFDWERALLCKRVGSSDLAVAILLYLILATGLYYCYLTRHVDSTLSNAYITTQCILYGTLCVITLYLLSLLNVDPYTYLFEEQLITMAVIGYIMYLQYFKLCWGVLFGADLDRSLNETRTSWSILDTRAVVVLSALIFRSGARAAKTVDVGGPAQDAETLARVKKYAELTTEQLDEQLKSLKGKIAELKTEMIVVENFKFTKGEFSSSNYTKN